MKNLLKIIVLFVFSLTLIACGSSNNRNDNDYISPKPSETESSTLEQEEIAPKEYTEEEYKSMCKEKFYDEVFFGKEDLEGSYVKIHLLLSEKYKFTSSDKSSSTLQEYDKKYSLKTNFYKCCVLREGTNSYVGRQINMWFSDHFDLDPDNYKTGQKITVYAQVISWSNNTWNGYNSVTIIPKYIETEK